MCNAVIEQWNCGHFRFVRWDVENCSKAQGHPENRCKDLGPRKRVAGKGLCPDAACKGSDGKAKKMSALPLPVTQHPPLSEDLSKVNRGGKSRETIYIGIDPEDEGILTPRAEQSSSAWGSGSARAATEGKRK